MNLIGSIVTLKPLQEQFFEEYHNMFSPVVRQALGLPPSSELQETTNFLKTAMVDPQYEKFYCIFDNQTNKLIGGITIRSKQHPMGQLGTWVNEQFWGGGRYQEALYLSMKEYFADDKHDSMVAFIEEKNERSLRAHQKFGFVIVEKTSEDQRYLPGKKSKKVVLIKDSFKNA